MTEPKMEELLRQLQRRVDALERRLAERDATMQKMPKRLPFNDDTPLSALVKKKHLLLLCNTIDTWRQYLINGQGVDDLSMHYFDFRVTVYDYRQMVNSLSLLFQHDAFVCSVYTVAWYFVLHSNFTVSHYSIYSAMLSLQRSQ